MRLKTKEGCEVCGKKGMWFPAIVVKFNYGSLNDGDKYFFCSDKCFEDWKVNKSTKKTDSDWDFLNLINTTSLKKAIKLARQDTAEQIFQKINQIFKEEGMWCKYCLQGTNEKEEKNCCDTCKKRFDIPLKQLKKKWGVEK